MTAAQAAALRLFSHFAAAGKVRAHEHRPPPEAKRPRHTGQFAGMGRGGNNRQEIQIGARRYRSMGAACAGERITYYALKEWLRDGRARYADADEGGTLQWQPRRRD